MAAACRRRPSRRYQSDKPATPCCGCMAAGQARDLPAFREHLRLSDQLRFVTSISHSLLVPLTIAPEISPLKRNVQSSETFRGRDQHATFDRIYRQDFNLPHEHGG